MAVSFFSVMCDLVGLKLMEGWLLLDWLCYACSLSSTLDNEAWTVDHKLRLFPVDRLYFHLSAGLQGIVLGWRIIKC